MKDEQLVRQYLKNGDKSALESLIKRYLPLIYGYARNYTGNADNASDIAQEVFVKAWQNLNRFDQSKSFRTWIFTIAKRTAIDWLRKKNAVPFSSFQDQEKKSDFADSLVDGSPSIFEQLLSREVSEDLVVAIAQLPASHATVIRMHINEDLKFREIAQFLKEPLNTVKNRYLRGMSQLKNSLKKSVIRRD